MGGRAGATSNGRTSATSGGRAGATEGNRAGASQTIPNEQSIQPPIPNEWAEVVEELTNCGVGKAGQAIEVAIRNEVSPDDVLAIVNFSKSKPGAFGGGAVYQRVINARPGQRFDDPRLWPDESPDYSRRCQTQWDTAIREREIQKEALRNRQLAIDQAEIDNLTRKYSPVWGSMTNTEQTEFARTHLAISNTSDGSVILQAQQLPKSCFKKYRVL